MVDRDDPDEREVTPELLWALADDGTRRTVLELLEMDADQVSLEEIADTLARTHPDAFSERPTAVKARLHHETLPRLDDLGIVEYESDTGVVHNLVNERLPGELEDDLRSIEDG